jgi:acyl-CoA thioesterase
MLADPQEVAEAVAAAMMAADRASTDSGIRLVEVRPGAAIVGLVVAAGHANGHGVCHGGVLFTLADTAFAIACNSHGPRAVAAGADIVFARPAAVGDELLAVAHERTRYGRSGVYDVTVMRGTEAIAEFRGRSRVVAATQPGSEDAGTPEVVDG